jgi:hypothetical protein
MDPPSGTYGISEIGTAPRARARKICGVAMALRKFSGVKNQSTYGERMGERYVCYRMDPPSGTYGPSRAHLGAEDAVLRRPLLEHRDAQRAGQRRGETESVRGGMLATRHPDGEDVLAPAELAPARTAMHQRALPSCELHSATVCSADSAHVQRARQPPMATLCMRRKQGEHTKAMRSVFRVPALCAPARDGDHALRALLAREGRRELRAECIRVNERAIGVDTKDAANSRASQT